jgi:integrase
MSGGHIRKRGGRRGVATWELKYDVDRADGRRQTVYRSFKGSKREAQVELARLLAQANAGGHVDPSKLTVADHVRARVAQWHAAGITSAKTHERYQELTEHQLARFPIGARPLQKLSHADIEAWHTALKTKGRKDGTGGVSARTIHHAHKLLTKALREGVKYGLVLRNVAVEERPPKIVAKPMQILSPEQVKDLAAKLAGRPICAPAVVSLFTGARRGELLALSWSAVNLDRKVMEIRAALEQTAEHGTRIKDPKTASGKRKIALPDIVVDTLREHRRQQLELRLALGLGKAPADALVFPSPGTERLWNPDAFSAAWNDVVVELGLGIGFHNLRHTHASQLIHAGVPITEIANRLGHASPATTLSIYAHMFEKDDSKAAAAINVALAGA